VYRIDVFFAGEKTPRKTLETENAAAVLAAIPNALNDHDGCERLEVFLDYTRLFRVDCQGNYSPG
jgi:hypothetical protein